MEEKLTREWMSRYWKDSGAMTVEAFFDIVWQAIEEDRAGRYEIGEQVEVQFMKPRMGVISVTDIDKSELLTLGGTEVRRPVAMRKMNREELVYSIMAKKYDNGMPWEYSMQTLELMAKDLGISTEVEVK